MSKLIEEINNVISKINENLTSELSGSKAKKLLVDIEGNLEDIEENAEAKHKSIVNKKVEELKKIINENLSGESGKTQDALNRVKSGLEEVKKEIQKSEEKVEGTASLGDEVDRAHGYIKDAAKTGAEIGKNIVPILGAGEAAGALIGLGAGVAGATAHTTLYAAQKGLTGGTELLEEAAGGAKELATRFMDGADKNLAKVLDAFSGSLEEKNQMLTQ